MAVRQLANDIVHDVCVTVVHLSVVELSHTLTWWSTPAVAS